MKITEHTERDDNNKTFYSLDIGDVFIITDSTYNHKIFPKEKFFYKTNGKFEDGNAVCLNDGRMKCFEGGLTCYKVNAELVVNTVDKNF